MLRFFIILIFKFLCYRVCIAQDDYVNMKILENVRKKFEKEPSVKNFEILADHVDMYIKRWNMPYDEAEKYIQYLDESIKKFDDSVRLTYHSVAASFHSKVGNYAMAEELLLGSLRYFESKRDTYNISKSYIKLFQIYENSKNIERGVYFLLKATPYTKNSINIQSYSNVFNNLGLTYKKMGEYALSAHFFRLALNQAKQAKDTAWIGITSGNLATVLRKLGQKDSLLFLLDTDIKYSLKFNLWVSAANALHEKALVFMEKGDLQKAKKSLDSAEQLVKPFVKEFKSRKKIYSTQAELLTRLNDFERALQYKDSAALYVDSLSELQTAKSLRQMREQYEFLEAQKEIQILSSRNKAKNSYLIVVLIALLAIVVIAVIMAKNWVRVRRKNKVIQQQKIELQELNTSKDKLFSVIGHDLRSPIANLQGLLNLASHEVLTQEDFQKYISVVQRNVSGLQEMLENLLQWSKGKVLGESANPERFDLQQLSSLNINFYYGIAQNKQILLEDRVLPDTWVKADKNQINLALRNLIGNALKFTKPGGQVIVAAQIQENHVLVSVSDTGIGIPPEKIKTIFELGKGRGTEGTSGERGVGLGLFLTKEAVEKNGGSIEVESKVGVGTVFRFTLPKG